VALSVDTEMWQPGTLIPNKIGTNHTYLAATNYWALLGNNKIEEDDSEEANTVLINNINAPTKSNKWQQRIQRRQEKCIIIDSAATSHFVSKDKNLLAIKVPQNSASSPKQ
jgi:hypothetical protein